MSRPLDGRAALVTGATSGIGRATALALAEAGARVVVNGRRQEKGEAVVAGIEDAGGEAAFVGGDLSEPAEVERVMDEAIDAFGGLDAAFNNAGVPGPTAPLHEQDAEAYAATFDLNVRGTLLCMTRQLRHMRERGGGAIVNNISTNGFEPSIPGMGLYTASKHALVGLTRAAAQENAAAGVRVNAVAPGPTRAESIEEAGDEVVEFLKTTVPAGRLGEPAEVAAAVVWLCSDAASFVTGHTLVADGGLLVRGMGQLQRQAETD